MIEEEEDIKKSDKITIPFERRVMEILLRIIIIATMVYFFLLIVVL